MPLPTSGALPSAPAVASTSAAAVPVAAKRTARLKAIAVSSSRKRGVLRARKNQRSSLTTGSGRSTTAASCWWSIAASSDRSTPRIASCW